MFKAYFNFEHISHLHSSVSIIDFDAKKEIFSSDSI